MLRLVPKIIIKLQWFSNLVYVSEYPCVKILADTLSLSSSLTDQSKTSMRSYLVWLKYLLLLRNEHLCTKISNFWQAPAEIDINCF